MTGAFVDEHDALLLDLDGTVYRGGQALPWAREAIDAAHRRGVAIRYVTNNASKRPDAVAEHLNSLKLSATSGEVSTSAQAAAAMLAERVPGGERVLIVGSGALAAEVEDVGLVPVRAVEEEPVAVVQGHSPDTGWRDLAEACLAIRAGALWVASNEDRTLPTERGELPGNGAMVAALRAATGATPLVAGKPERPLLERAVASARARRPLMVGDRLDTDIAGAVHLGIPSLMVLTGVNTATDLLRARPEQRPTHVAADLASLTEPSATSAVAEQRDWKVRVTGAGLELSANADDPVGGALSALRALCAAWWSEGSGPVELRAADAAAVSALRELDM